jgi:hypothetical protein
MQSLTNEGLHKVFSKMKVHHFIQIYCNNNIKNKVLRENSPFSKYYYDKFINDMIVFAEIFTCGNFELIFNKITYDHNTAKIYKTIQANIINFRYFEHENEIYLVHENKA